MKKHPVIEKKLVGLYPILPLMEKSEDETDENILKDTISVIKTVDNESLQADLLAVTSILASERFTSDLVKNI